MTEIREYKAAGIGAAVVVSYVALVLASGRVDPAMFGKLLTFYVGIAFPTWIFIGGLAFFGQMIAGSVRAGAKPFLFQFIIGFFHQRWVRDRGVSLIWPPLLFALLLTSFNAFKQMILPLAGFGWDPILAEADKALFLGVDPWRVTHALFGSASATTAIDRVYHSWFLPMSLGLIACAWLPASTFRLRTQYVLSYIAVWIGIGSILAFLMPSAGPCFYERFIGDHASFGALGDRLAATDASGSPLLALKSQAFLIHSHGADRLMIGGGISAMPSVHNALAVLFALAAFRINRIVGWVVAAYAVVIWIGSIHLGWHYALDGVVAFGLTLGIWTLCGRIAASLDRDPVVLRPAAALA